MNWGRKLSAYIDDALPDDLIVNDLKEILWMDDPPGKVELDSDVITVPEAVTITVITKAFFSERFSIGFGSGFRVLVGIGDIQEGDAGYQLTCRYCFATLHYDEHCQLITEDFHSEMR